MHGPYQHGGGYPAVNGVQAPSLFDPALPPQLVQQQTGLGLQNVFTSETGGVTMSSFESMAPFLKEEHWGIHGGLPADNCSQTCVALEYDDAGRGMCGMVLFACGL